MSLLERGRTTQTDINPKVIRRIKTARSMDDIFVAGRNGPLTLLRDSFGADDFRQMRKWYLTRNPTGGRALLHGLKFIRNSTALGLIETAAAGITHLAGSEAAPAVFHTAEYTTAGAVALGSAQLIEGTIRSVKNIKRRYGAHKETKKAKNSIKREVRAGEKDRESQEQSLRLKEEAKRGMLRAEVLIIGAGAHGKEFAERYSSIRPDARIILVDSQEGRGGVWRTPTPFNLNTRSADLGRRRLFGGVQTLYPSNLGPHSLVQPGDFARGTQGGVPTSKEMLHAVMMSNAGETMLDVTAAKIRRNPTTTGRFTTTVYDNTVCKNTHPEEKEEYQITSDFVIDARGLGDSDPTLKEQSGNGVYTSTEIRKDIQPLRQALLNGQRIAIVGGRDEGMITAEMIVDTAKELRADANPQKPLPNVNVDMWGTPFSDKLGFETKTILRYKGTLGNHMQFYPGAGGKTKISIYPDIRHVNKIDSSTNDLPVINDIEYGLVITAIGRKKDPLLYEGGLLEGQLELVYGRRWLPIGAKVVNEEGIYSVGPTARIPLSEGLFMDEKDGIHPRIQAGYANSLGHLIPKTGELATMVAVEVAPRYSSKQAA